MEEFKKWIESELDTRGWSYNELARNADLSSSFVSMVMTDQRRPTYRFCSALAKAFNFPLEDVLRRAGLLPSEPDDDMLDKEISRMLSTLTVEEQEMVIEMIRGLYERKIRRATTISRPKTASQT